MLRKHYIIALVSCFLMITVTPLLAQQPRPKNLPKFDYKDYHFGFTLGINSTDFILSQDLSKGDSVLVIESQRQAGFNLGIISDLHMGPYFNLRFIPSLSFGQRNLEYTYMKDGSKEFISKPIESTFVEFPLHVKYRSERLNNFAAYIIAGGKYDLDLASQHDVENHSQNLDELVIKLKRHSYLYEVGFGMDFFMQYFKFSPEIKMSFGLNNVLIDDGTFFSTPVESLRSKMFLLSFHFEG